MRMFRALCTAGAAMLAFVTTTQAQDSVSIPGCFPGDATSPWDDQFGPFGTEQCDTYVVDLATVQSSWGNSFGVAPLSKSGQIDPFLFFSSLMGGTGISRDTLRGQKFSAPTYSFWDQPGFGVSNDPSANTAGTPVSAATLRGTQFAAVFADSGLTSGGSAYNGVVSTIVNIDPSDPSRLYVNKVRVGTNSCDPFSDLAAVGVGSVDANGNVVFRADPFGMMIGSGCSTSIVTGNNIFLVDSLARSCNSVNVISGSSASFDPAMVGLVTGSGSTLPCPGIVPESITGGAPIYIGTDFNNNFLRGSTPASITIDGTYLDPSLAGTRGNLAYLGKNFPALASTHGICGMLGTTNDTAFLNLWGLDSVANVTGTLVLALPATVTDNFTGYVSATSTNGVNEFDHYHSQVPFQGGNGCVAMNVDPAGNLLAAAEVDHPDDGPSSQWGGNYIAVCRVDPVSGAQSWTMAGYVDPVTGNGKPILDGPNGNVVAEMTMLPTGPTVSAPMIDAAGNVYFLSFMTDLQTFNTHIGLIKAVYDPTTFSYQLELMLRTGQVVHGRNSNRDYLISSLRLTDSNSIASDAPWSQSISQDSFLGLDGSCFAPGDPRALGGMVVAANLLYDRDNDGVFDGDQCLVNGSLDEEYRVLLYVGSVGATGVKSYGQGCAGFGGFEPVLSWDGYPSGGKDATITIDSGIGGQSALVFLSFAGPAAVPVGGGCSLNLASPLIGPVVLPLFGTGAGGGSISIPTTLPAIPAGAKVYLQAFCTDPTKAVGATATKGLEITFQ